MSAVLPLSREPVSRPIVRVPDPRLSQKSEAVDAIDGDILALVGDMVETARGFRAHGLSAVQIGVLQRIVLLNTGKQPRPYLAMINPEIFGASDQVSVGPERCLSIPLKSYDVERHIAVRTRFLDVHGVQHEVEFQGLAARIIQHTVDLLDGVLISERLSRGQHEAIARAAEKRARRGQRAGRIIAAGGALSLH